jgi:pimeloyl-ACP methyl ester carboxylesterase
MLFLVSAFLRARSPLDRGDDVLVTSLCLPLTCASHWRNHTAMSHPDVMSTGHLEVNSARLYYELRGTGPSLLFIPGGTVDSSHFTAVADLLADQFRTVSYDRRGNGNSPRPAGWHATSLSEQADDVAGLIEALGLAPCAVWGGSFGGVVLLELLTRRPGLVRAAMVHEPPLFTVLDDGDLVADHLVRTAAAAVRTGRIEDALTDHARAVLADAFDRLPPDSRARMLANAQVFFDLEVPALVRSLPDIATLSRALDQVDIALTFMADPDSRDAPPVRAARWLADRRHTALRELPGGHMPYLTEPGKTAEAIRALLHS